MQSVALQLPELLLKLKPRAKHANKRDFGQVLILAGDQGMPGAARICAEACMRVGAGLVTLATHPAHANTATINRPEIICYGVNNTLQLSANLEKTTIIAMGPGLSQSAWSQELAKFLLAHNLPMIIDGGALDIIKTRRSTHSNWIITPHPGEAARLLDTSPQMIQADRVTAINKLQQRYACVVVLKGAETLIADGKTLSICLAGNPGMASAGMGDLLTGMITGLVAQGLSLIDAAKLGVILHATAGDMAAKIQGQHGLLALDLMPYIQQLLKQSPAIEF